MPRVRAVFFDLYGTLAHFHPPREEIQTRAAADHGIRLTKEGIRAGYKKADELMAYQNQHSPLRTMSRDERERFFARYEQLILEAAGSEVDKRTAAAVWATVREQRYRLALYDDVTDALDRLRAGGRSIAALSNLNESGRSISRRLGLKGHIDFAVTSGEVGAEKPDPRMFYAALSQASVEPHEAVHVGDQLSSDIEGARGVGIRPILMDREGRYPEFDGPRTKDMSDVVAAVARMESKHDGKDL